MRRSGWSTGRGPPRSFRWCASDEVPLAAAERCGGEIDRAIRNGVPLHKVQKDFMRFLAGSAAQFDDDRNVSGAFRQLAGVIAQQSNVGASQSVLGKQCDRFEERRAEVIVKVFRIEFLLTLLRQTGAHVRFEFCSQNRISWRSGQSRL